MIAFIHSTALTGAVNEAEGNVPVHNITGGDMKNSSIAVFLLSIVLILPAGIFMSGEIAAQNKVYKIGEHGPAGGWIFYDKGEYTDGWRYLEAAPEDLGNVKWGCENLDIPAARGEAVGTGKKNTAEILKACPEPDIAARKAADYRGGGKSDWFLPSIDEMDELNGNLYGTEFKQNLADIYWTSTEIDAGSAYVDLIHMGNFSNGAKSNGNFSAIAIRSF